MKGYTGKKEESANPYTRSTNKAETQVYLSDNRVSSCVQRNLDNIANQSSSNIRIAQLQGELDSHSRQSQVVIQNKINDTGLPDNLKNNMEMLSGHSLDHVKVHYNSSKPSAVQAHAYAQGTNIYLGPGQDQHLPHEAWHVVQQAQGRVKPTVTVNGMSVNDDAHLEHEATVMGEKAVQMKSSGINGSTDTVRADKQ